MRRMKDKQTNKARAEQDWALQDRALDEALEGTFPASDPISMQQIVIVGRAGTMSRSRPARERGEKITAAARDKTNT
jgi:hypothetical protein